MPREIFTLVTHDAADGTVTATNYEDAAHLLEVLRRDEYESLNDEAESEYYDAWKAELAGKLAKVEQELNAHGEAKVAWDDDMTYYVMQTSLFTEED